MNELITGFFHTFKKAEMHTAVMPVVKACRMFGEAH